MAVYIIGWVHSFEGNDRKLIPPGLLDSMAEGIRKLTEKDENAILTTKSLNNRVKYHRTRHMTSTEGKQLGW